MGCGLLLLSIDQPVVSSHSPQGLASAATWEPLALLRIARKSINAEPYLPLVLRNEQNTYFATWMRKWFKIPRIRTDHFKIQIVAARDIDKSKGNTNGRNLRLRLTGCFNLLWRQMQLQFCRRTRLAVSVRLFQRHWSCVSSAHLMFTQKTIRTGQRAGTS